MKHMMISALLLLLPLGINAQELFVGTYNIRQLNSGDDRAGNGWATRCKVVCDQINFESPDALGVQEAFAGQLRDMQANLDNYAYIGVGRDDGKEEGEYSAIFYKKDRLKLLNSGNFWLSETPDVPCKGWDAACVRICSWGEFSQTDSQLRFFHFNLHMDHVGTVARREAARLVVQKIHEIAQGAPVVLTGDFNVDQHNEIFRIFTESGILKDSYDAARLRFAENGTFNSFDSRLWSDSRIDHVMVSPHFEVNRYGILTDAYWTDKPAQTRKGKDAPGEIDFCEKERRSPSDHYPVLVHLKAESAQ